MAEDVPHVFDQEGARRIVDVVRRVENMPRNLRRDVERLPNPVAQPFWLAQTAAYRANGNSDTGWTIYSGSTKGSETATSYTSFSQKVYVRFGCAIPGVIYSLYFVDGM